MLFNKSLFARCALLSCMAILSACSTGWDLDNLKRTTVKGDEYTRAIAAGYLKYSESEAKAYDWESSQYFAKKGLLAAYGHKVEPENPENWKIMETLLPEVKFARESLIKALAAPHSKNLPVQASSAILNYDCWVEQLNDGWNSREARVCRDDFYEALNAITVGAPAVTKFEKTLFFSSGSSSLDNEAMKVIDEVIKDINNMGTYDIVLNGHTDHTGKPKANMELGLKRAEAVKQALVRGGINHENISTYSFGATDHIYGNSRRVQIFVNE